MYIETVNEAAQQLYADMPNLITHQTYTRQVITARIESLYDTEETDREVFQIPCQNYILNGGSFGNPTIIQFDALGFEEDMLAEDSDSIAKYYHAVTEWPKLRNKFLNNHKPEVYWLHIWQNLFQHHIGSRTLYTFKQLNWLGSVNLPLNRKLLLLASNITTNEEYKPFIDAPDMYIMTLMSVPNQSGYHQFKNDFQPEHGPFMLAENAGMRDPIMFKLINEGKVLIDGIIEA